MTAIGVLHGLYRTTHKVPDDISVVGFDDIHLAEYTIPPLTTVRMSCKDLAQGAVTSLLANMESTQSRFETRSKINTRLIVRQTTGLPKMSSAI